MGFDFSNVTRSVRVSIGALFALVCHSKLFAENVTWQG